MATETDTRNVHRRKLAVMKRCDAIQLDSTYDATSKATGRRTVFQYLSVMAASNHLRKFCVEEGLDVIPSFEDGRLVITLVNADNPEDRIVSHWPVVPDDKAWAYTVKWALIRTFLIGDGEEGDQAELAGRSGQVAIPATVPHLDPEAKERIVNEAREAKGHNSPPRRPDAPRVGPASLPGRPSVPGKPANVAPDAPEEWFDDAALAAMDTQR